LLDIRELVEQQPVPGRRRGPDRPFAPGSDPDRRMRLLLGPRLDHDVAEAPVRAVVGEPLGAGPGPDHHREALLVASLRLGRVDAEAVELVGAVSEADAEVQPSS
jgi:hypothetical protein